MRKLFIHSFIPTVLFVSILLPVLLSAQSSLDKYNTYLKASNQVVFVTADNWNATQATMQLYQRTKKDQPWKLVRGFPVTLGRNGLGIDRNSPLPKPHSVVIKKEGDGKSPAGLFRLGPVFSRHSLDKLKMPFTKADTADICVDDIHSAFYNKWVNTDTARQKDWNSFEYMKSKDDSYEYGVWVRYNSGKIFSGNGSCIFLHVWAGSTSPTAGCTAMEKQNMISVIHWLDNSKRPVLLQIVDKQQ